MATPPTQCYLLKSSRWFHAVEKCFLSRTRGSRRTKASHFLSVPLAAPFLSRELCWQKESLKVRDRGMVWLRLKHTIPRSRNFRRLEQVEFSTKGRYSKHPIIFERSSTFQPVIARRSIVHAFRNEERPAALLLLSVDRPLGYTFVAVRFYWDRIYNLHIF
jgi:hypothetical protein